MRETGYLNVNYLLICINGTKDNKKKLCENGAKRNCE